MFVESSLHEKAECIVIFEIFDWWEATDTREDETESATPGVGEVR